MKKFEVILNFSNAPFLIIEECANKSLEELKLTIGKYERNLSDDEPAVCDKAKEVSASKHEAISETFNSKDKQSLEIDVFEHKKNVANLEIKKNICKGRPKLMDQNVIGTRKKKIPKEFLKRPAAAQALAMLKWLNLPEVVIMNLLDGEYVLTYNDASRERNLEPFLNKKIPLKNIKRYCEDEAFLFLSKQIDLLRNGNKHVCLGCFKSLGEKNISCDGCLCFYHEKCASLPLTKKKKEAWFCVKCINEFGENNIFE